MNQVLLTIENGVARISLNNAERGNSLSPELKEELTAILRSLKSDTSVRAVVLTGEGRFFSAGGDIKAMKVYYSTVDRRDRVERASEWLKELVTLEKPVIAAVNGAAAGAGLSMALACDFIIAADDAKLICSFGNMSLVPDMGGMYFLTRRLGIAKAKMLAMTSRRVKAPEALEIGLADMVVPKEELIAEATKLAEQLAARPTYALGLTKRLANMSFDLDFNTYLELEANYQTIAFQTADHAGAVDSFIEKQTPQYTGR